MADAIPAGTMEQKAPAKPAKKQAAEQKQPEAAVEQKPESKAKVMDLGGGTIREDF